ncbi:MAG: nitroreductase family protein, partial [Oscillospiraceae bacterium]|nr:nitroreductase family protein [Oscillospiraceae bacterium]
IAFEKLYFRGDFSAPLTPDQAGDFAQALELTRWAPSATNKQPWRAVAAGDTVHFYEERTMRDTPLGDIQKVDMGIALCHFDLAMEEEGHAGRFVFADPGLAAPERTEYIVSYVKEK